MALGKFRLVAILLLGLVLAGCGTEAADTAPERDVVERVMPLAGDESLAASENATVKAKGPVLVFLGDSLTAGFGLGPEFALPEQIGVRLEAAGLLVDVVNAGVSGDTTSGGLARYDWSVASAEPDLVFVALGANDYLSGGSPDQARENLQAILTRIKADGAQAVLASVEARSSGIDDPRAEAFSRIYPELAAEFDVPHFVGLLSKVRGRSDLLLQDGLHPTAEGIGLMADDVAAFLMPVLAELRKSER
jgi:acyl-CoA thioesterase-1